MPESKLIQLNLGEKAFDILPFESNLSPSVLPGYRELDIGPSQKSMLSSLMGQVPAMMESKEIAQAYIVKWPEGAYGELMNAKNSPGYRAMLRDPISKHIVTHGELYPMEFNALALSGFTALSAVTGQYFLAEINQKMEKISQGIDKILEFLYGDKKAELLSEVSFVKYANDNFSSIANHPEQCTATVSSLQEAKKTAIKDIEFYMADLYSTAHRKVQGDVEALVRKAFQIKECLELSAQLYMTATVLEAYYSGNFDKPFIAYITAESSHYISKCEKQMLGDFNVLHSAVENFKPMVGSKKPDKERLLRQIDSSIDIFNGPWASRLNQNVQTALEAPDEKREFCITKAGKVYLKVG